MSAHGWVHWPDPSRMVVMETWLPYPPDPRYAVSSGGHVRGSRGKILTGYTTDDGYRVVKIGLGKSGKYVAKRVHVMVLETFVGPRPEGLQACHNDGNPNHNAVDNLRWDTPRNNSADKHAHGTHVVGESHGIAKLTDVDVQEIRSLYPMMTKTDIALRFGVSDVLVGKIISRKLWQHI